MSAPISYYGGKQRIARHIIKLIPQHKVYVEPFFGGGAVFWNKPHNSLQTHYIECINDKDEQLINFYKQLRENGEELIKRLQLTPYSKAEYVHSKNLADCDDLEKARRYFVLIMQGFNHKLKAGWGRSVTGNLAQFYRNKVNNLDSFIHRLQHVTIECDDALRVIKLWDSPQTFFYCDPPYPNTNQGHYAGYTEEQLQELVNVLDQCSGSFILSNYDQANINIPENWGCKLIQTQCSARGRANYDRRKIQDESSQNRLRTEKLWFRSNLFEPRADIQKHITNLKLPLFW